MAGVSPDTPLYNSRIYNSYLKLLRERYCHVSIPELLDHAGMSELEVADPGHWFTQRQTDLFHEKLVQLTGNPGIAREAGRRVASPGVSGFLRDIVLCLAGPERVFSLMSRLAANFSRSCSYSTRKLGARELEITVTPEEGVQENPRQCENRMGSFESIFLMFGHALPEIRHDDCVFRGARACRYRISWDASPVERLTLLRRLSFVFLILALIAAARLAPVSATGIVFLATFVCCLVLVVWIQRLERKALLDSIGGIRSSSEMHLERIKENYDSALMINEIGEAIASRTDLGDILGRVSQVLCTRLKYGRGLVLLADATRNALVLKSSFGLDLDTERVLQALQLPLGEGAGTPGPLTRCFKDQSYLLVKDLSEVANQITAESYGMFSALGVKSFLCAPILCEGESLGVLAVDDSGRDGELSLSDLNLMRGVAPVIGIAIKNATRLANERDLSEQLRKASEQLERRVVERTAELNRAYEELEFLYDSVSHDLRAPLRVIYGYGELLLDGYGDRLDASAREYLTAMIHGGERMESTLDRMLDLAELRMMELVPEKIDLSEMARGILKDLQTVDPRPNASIRVEDGVTAIGDRRLLISIMENLLGNAWKYSGGKEASAITFGVKEGAFFVSDNGAGFDMAQADRLFVPFQRLHHSAAYAGHGLGLSMVRTMVERLGGKVWGMGVPGEGATFYFTVG